MKRIILISIHLLPTYLNIDKYAVQVCEREREREREREGACVLMSERYMFYR